MKCIDDSITIHMIPVDRIRVLNPRVRDRNRFLEIVDSIRKVGIKQPIKVSRGKGSGKGAEYHLVYGQGRLEAFRALGQKEIPAIVTGLTEQESLILSLVENVARRKPRPVEGFRAISELVEKGYTDEQIGAKIGYVAEYVRNIRRLLDAGEERLLDAVATGKIPVHAAVEIAGANDEQIQQVLTEAREKYGLTIRELRELKRQIERRQRYGKTSRGAQSNRSGRKLSAAAEIRSLKRAAKQKEMLIKRADLADAQLRFVVEGLRMLMDDEHFVTLLRAEGHQTMPAPLAQLMQEYEDG